jgi:hypothetical protein
LLRIGSSARPCFAQSAGLQLVVDRPLIGEPIGTERVAVNDHCVAGR